MMDPVEMRKRQIYFYLLEYGLPDWFASQSVGIIDPLGPDLDKSLGDYLKYLGTPMGKTFFTRQETAYNKQQQAAKTVRYGETDFPLDYASQYDPRTGQAWNEQYRQEADWNKLATEANTNLAIQQAREKRIAESASEAERKWYESQGPMPGYGEQTAGALGGLAGTPAMQRYFENELKNLYGEQGMGEKRAAWWKEKTKFVPAPGAGMSEAEGANLTPEQSADLSKGGQFYQSEQEERKRMMDPWQAFLSNYPFLEKFRGLTPQAKGFYSGTFRPRTRFL